MPEQIYSSIQIPNIYFGKRLDQVLVHLLTKYSRSLIKKWIDEDCVQINGKSAKASDKIRGGETVTIIATIPSILLEGIEMPLDILYEDNDILIINKPINLVVHPGAGNYENTLLNGIIYKYPMSKNIPRGGIVHRLDKDTSGLMVIAKNIQSYYQLIEDISARKIQKEYEAIVHGKVKINASITTPIGRNPHNRIKMAVTPKGKEALTEYSIIKKYQTHTHLHLKIITGRTHQIRVHLSHINAPIVGDKTYGKKITSCSPLEKKLATAINRQALHAKKLSFLHPITRKDVSFNLELPNDMKQIIQILEHEDVLHV